MNIQIKCINKRVKPWAFFIAERGKKTIFVTAGIFITLACFSQTQPPTIKEVAAKFYNTYDVDSLPYPVVRFEKRKTEWKIVTQKFEAGKWVDVDTFLFYNGNEKKYLPLPLPAKEDTNFVDYRNYVDYYNETNYTIQPYYGYRGWYKDVIADLGNETQLSDSALYALARAYSEYASDLLYDQYNLALTNETFDMPLARNCMNEEQRNEYHAIIQKAIDCYAQVGKINPNFQTVVGNIRMKYANEVLVEFHTYLTYADEYARTYSLPDNLYPDSIIEKTKKILESCPKNAIFLSEGDNDLYRVLYVQQKMGYRQDVHAINISLLGIDRYIFMATQPQFQSPPVKLSVAPEYYKNDINNIVLVEDIINSAISFNNVIDIIKNGNRDTNNISTIPSSTFIINRKSDKTGIFVKTNNPPFYLYKNDWILLDILNNLDGRAFVSQYPLYNELSFLNNYLTKINDILYTF